MHLRERLYYWSGKLQHRITPGLPYSQTVFEQRLFTHVARSRSWLDLGCGHRILPEWRGESEERLVAQSPFVVGLDADAQALQRHRSIRNLCLGDITRLPFRDGSFQVVFHQGLLEHFRDPRPLLVENARVVRSGGRLVVDVPQTWHLYTAMKKVLIAFGAWFAGWETQFTVGQLETLLTSTGLRVKRSYGDWMVPGLWYRVTREVLRRGVNIRLPLEPRGPEWWASGWESLRRSLHGRRWALSTCHVIGTVAERP